MLTMRFIIAVVVQTLVGVAASAQPTIVLRVVKDNNCQNTCGLTWETAFPSIQDALDTAYELTRAFNVQIWVAQGTYTPSRDVGNFGDTDAAKTFLLEKGISLYGGFEGGESSIEDRLGSAEDTILCGIQVLGKSARVVVADELGPDDVIDGFQIQEGRANITGHYPRGGAISVRNSEVTIRNCIFRDNTAIIGGGALLFSQSSKCLVENCIFEDNRITQGNNINDEGGGGGAIVILQGSEVTLRGCDFRVNQSGQSNRRGGAVHIDNGQLNAESCRFDQNESVEGGAVFTKSASVVFTNCSFTHNLAAGEGGAVRHDPNSGNLYRNCTFSENMNAGNSGTIDMADNVMLVMRNSIVWNSAGPNVLDGGMFHDILFSNIPGIANIYGPTNIDADPLFEAIGVGVDPILSEAVSPCIDAADSTYLPSQFTTDLTGLPREIDGNGDNVPVIDMGAFERPCPSCPGVTRWIGGVGDFSDDDNWDNGAPSPIKTAMFDGVGGIATLTEPVEMAQMRSFNGAMTIELDGHPLIMNSSEGEDTLIVGRDAGDMATLEFAGGGDGVSMPVDANTVIGDAVDADGLLIVSGANVFTGGALFVAFAGDGSVHVRDGGMLVSLASFIGVKATADGNVRIEDGGVWLAQTIEVVRGIVEVVGSGVVEMFGGELQVRAGGVLAGNGTIIGDTSNIGHVIPMGSPFGVLTMEGDYAQIGASPLFGTLSGTLNVELGDGVNDVLVVEGNAELAGGFVAQAGEDFTVPTTDTTYPVVIADSNEGETRFDVVLLPNLKDIPGFDPDNPVYLALSYDYSRKGMQATIRVRDLQELISIALIDGAIISGEGIAADVDEITGDTFPDIVVAVSGDLFVLGNRGDANGDGMWDGFELTSGPIPIGLSPTAVEIADLDDDDLPDVVVTDSEDFPLVALLNMGGGNLDVPIEIQAAAGIDTPTDVAQIDLDGKGGADLLVTDSRSGNPIAGSLFVLENIGGLDFDPCDLPTGPLPCSVDPLDIDKGQDGNGGAAVGNLGDNTITVFSLDGVFEEVLTLSAGNGGDNEPVFPGEMVLAAELDRKVVGGGPTLEDLISITNTSDVVSVLLNTFDGEPSFAPAVALPLGPGAAPSSVAAVDIDGDSDTDLALVVNTPDGLSRELVILRNDLDEDGALVFATPETVELGDVTPVQVFAADLDGDGLEDLVTLNVETEGGGQDLSFFINGISLCPPDCDGNGTLNILDFVCYQQQFASGNLEADCNRDGELSILDFICFQLQFMEGCP